MKYLRQYIRQILITEGMKQPSDLPDNTIIVINPNMPGGTEIYYALAGNVFDRPGRGDPAKGSVSIYDIQPHPNYGSCGNAWMVGGSWSSDGWGPLLYDVAIEWATQNGGGLIADRGAVSEDAEAVWRYYMRRRSDVTAHQLDDPFNLLTPDGDDNCDQEVAGGGHFMYGGDKDFGKDWVKSALSKRYTKAPIMMNALKMAGKLEVLG